MVLAGAGVGGGSLVYSNVLYEPKSDAFYTDKQWAHITDWRQELAPHYDQAERMLGCAESPTSTVVDELTRKVAAEMGVERSLELTPVGVFFGREGRKEPGVDAEERILGMTGCRHGAKNTLVKNYLYLAESAGAAIHPESTVTTVRPLPGGRYRVIAGRTGAWRRRIDDRAFTADHVVISAGTWGTQQLLHRMKTDGVLPHLSGRLGLLSRTNSESIGSVTTKWRHRGITTSLRASRSHRHSNPTSTPSSKRSATEGA
jgi:cholesterol oxidase